MQLYNLKFHPYRRPSPHHTHTHTHTHTNTDTPPFFPSPAKCDAKKGPKAGPCPVAKCAPPAAGCSFVTKYEKNSDGKCCPKLCYSEDSEGKECPPGWSGYWQFVVDGDNCTNIMSLRAQFWCLATLDIPSSHRLCMSFNTLQSSPTPFIHPSFPPSLHARIYDQPLRNQVSGVRSVSCWRRGRRQRPVHACRKFPALLSY